MLHSITGYSLEQAVYQTVKQEGRIRFEELCEEFSTHSQPKLEESIRHLLQQHQIVEPDGWYYPATDD